MPCAITDAQSTWAARTPLLSHQKQAVAKLLPTRVGALFMEMGTGKTRTTIELARLRQHKIDRIVWFCPVSLKETIRREILKHTDCGDDAVYVFDHRTRSDRLPVCTWYIIGLESMSSSPRVIFSADKLVTDRTMVVCDESSYIKGHRAKRTERITLIAERARYRLILTGTPISQGIQDLYTQMRFLSPRILGYRSWYSFQRNHLEYSDKYKGMIVRTNNTEWLAAKIRPYIYQVTKAECLSLPDKLAKSYWCHLSTEQAEAYHEAKEQFIEDMLTYDDPHSQFCSSVPIFRLFTALQSIVCGWDPGRERSLQHHRLDALMTVISGIPDDAKLVIWGKYHHAINEIVTELSGCYGSEAVAQFHGGLNERRRNSELSRWRDEARFLVATQSAGGFGLDLTAAHYVVFYANGFKYSERIQAEDRCHRIGQSQPVTYIDLWADCKIESRIQNALDSKQNAVDQFKREVDKIKEPTRLKDLIRSL